MATLDRVISKSSIRAKQVHQDQIAVGQTIVGTALEPADKTYNATSTPAGTKFGTDTIALSGSGAASQTIDLTDSPTWRATR